MEWQSNLGGEIATQRKETVQEYAGPQEAQEGPAKEKT